MNVARRTRGFRAALAAAVSVAGAMGAFATACAPGHLPESSGAPSCESTRAYFLNEVWGPVMGKTCVTCHAPGGQAALQNAKLSLLPASYPDFADANLRSVSEIVKVRYVEGDRSLSELVAKPLGKMKHGGGAVIVEGSPEYAALTELAARLEHGPDGCVDAAGATTTRGVTLLDYPSTLRKATLHLAARLPTAAEYAQAASGESGFDAAMESVFAEPAFVARVKIAFNDVVLTDRYVVDNGCDKRALNLLDEGDFPNRGAYAGGGAKGLDCCDKDYANAACVAVRDSFRDANNAIASEPMALLEHVVKNDLPFSEILTADYVMVNPMSAHVYGVDSQVTFDDPANPKEFRQARVAFTRITDKDKGTTRNIALPHAGVLTTAAFLDRHPTTDTNRNRHRARIVQKLFLATDILKVGERPIDPTAAEAQVQTPTMNYGACVMCHKVNDPVAGAFRGWDFNGQQGRYNPTDPWYNDMFPPGFAGEDMPGAQYATGLQWLAQKIVADPRFVSSTVRFAYTELTGHEPLSFPIDTSDPLYVAKAAAWGAQDAAFRAAGDAFVANNMNLKTAFLSLLKTPYFRAVAGPEALDDVRSAELTDVGTARLLPPELLNQKIKAIAGVRWSNDYGKYGDWLLRDYYLSYGGIDSDTVSTRITNPNGLVVNIAARMANEVACAGTAFDFTRPKAERRFFVRVEPNVVPEVAGAVVPADVEQIRENIAYLHGLVLGEPVGAADPEVERTYQLFLETWREASASTDHDLACPATNDPETGRELDMATRITTDKEGTIRAWMAVMTYLFSDYRFLFE